MTFNAAYLKVRQLLTFNKNDVEGNRQAFAFMMFMFCTLAVFTPEIALADPWDQGADWVLGILTGGLTRTIAIICVIGCGVAAFAGKLSIDWAVKIVAGIVLVFGAATIVDAMIGAVS